MVIGTKVVKETNKSKLENRTIKDVLLEEDTQRWQKKETDGELSQASFLSVQGRFHDLPGSPNT